jgi:hypothetical protein
LTFNRQHVVILSKVELFKVTAVTASNPTFQHVVGIATGYGLDNEGSEFESWYGQEFSLLHVVQTGSRVDPTSYLMSNGGCFPGGKAAGA